jgi:hypothetical protein
MNHEKAPSSESAFCDLEVRRGEPYRADEQHQTKVYYELFFDWSKEKFF